MLGILAQPKQQSAEAAIITLCDRLEHSTLLEDRSSSALALKGFSHEYRELIASNGLQGLIDALKTDYHDTELRRACLETLVILFIKTGPFSDDDLVENARRVRERNKLYVSPLIRRPEKHVDEAALRGDEISLWLTDRFTQDPANIEMLISFVDASHDTDVFSTLYSLQLLSALVLNRSDSARECLLKVPNGISALVSTLNSSQEMIRNEGVLLLLNLTENHLDSQKLVAFEGGFDAIFRILHDEGGLAYGTSALVVDALGLLTNLLQYNVSNQKLFCESSCVAKFDDLLNFEPEYTFSNDIAVQNIVAALHLPRLFCIPGADSTAYNQNNFSVVLFTTLRLAFGPLAPLSVRVASLMTAASLVWQNPGLQEEYSKIDVPYYDLSLSMNIQKEPQVVPVEVALLNWLCFLTSTHMFDLRAACLYSLMAIFKDNTKMRSAFLTEQLARYVDGTTSANIISILAEYNENAHINPFQIWFTCVLTMNIFDDSHELKDQLRAVKIGDEKLGQEVSSILGSMGSQLLSALDYREPFVALGYLQLLAVWLFDDVDAVNEFLQESSVVQGLINYVSAHRSSDPSHVLVQSLACILLGIVYDFSSKTSPLSRAELFKLLDGTLGKTQYAYHIKWFKESKFFKDYDAAAIFGAQKGENGLPQVYLDSSFIEFMSLHFNRIQKALNKGPDYEPSSRVSLEMYEELKSEFLEKKQEYENFRLKKESEIKDVMENEAAIRTELSKLKEAHQDLSDKHSIAQKEREDFESQFRSSETTLNKTTANLRKITEDYESKVDELANIQDKLETSEKAHRKVQAQFEKVTQAKEKLEDGINKMSRELMTLTREKESTEKELKGVKHDLEKLRALTKKHEQQISSLQSQNSELQGQNADGKQTIGKLIRKLKETAAILSEKEEDEALLEQAQDEIEKYKLESHHAHQQNATLKTENQAVKEDLEKAQKEAVKFESEAAELREQFNVISKERDTSKKEAEKFKKIVNSTKEFLQATEQRAKDLESKVTQLEKEKAESATESSKTKALESELKILRQKAQSVEEKNARIKELESEISESRRDNSKQSEQAAEVDRLQKKVEELEKEYTKKEDSKLKDQQAKLSEFEKENASLKKQLEQAKKSTVDEQKLKKVQEELEEKQSALDELMELLDAITEKNSTYKQKLRDLQQEVSESEDDDEDEEE